MNRRDQPIIVVKVGGSILGGGKAYERVGSFLRDRLEFSFEQHVVVVSAERGQTDALERIAQRIVPTPESRIQDLLWATGELRSVAILTMHLHRLSVPAVGLNVHETGLRVRDAGDVPGRVTLDSQGIRDALDRYRVVVVPGFLATNAAGSIVSLGRGGSDLTAVLLAIYLDAVRCELVKNVGGYFTQDPRVEPRAEHIRSLSYEQALAMADDGCELVQREAIEMASASNLPILIRGVGKADLRSVISSAPSHGDPTDAVTGELSVRD